LKILLILIVIIFIFEFLIYQLIKKIKFSKWILTSENFNYLFNKKKFQKFKNNNYSENLGWDKKKNLKNYEIRNNEKIFYSINKNGFRESNYTKYKNRISTFGDSYTFCRQSKNNETWQEIISKDKKEFVSNYGVGNYGLDQAFIKYQKTKLNRNTKIVIFGIVPETICRIQSVWKNYMEFGNVHGFKPYCTLKNKKIIIKKNLLKRKHKFKDLKTIIKNVNKVDRFYNDKYKKYIFKSPYIIYFLKNFSFNLKISIKYLTLLIKKKNTPEIIESNFFPIVMKQNIILSHKLYDEEYSKFLLKSLIIKINNEVKKKNKRKCFFVILPQLYDLRVKTRKNYQKFFKKIDNKLNMIDTTNLFLKQKNFSKLYISDKYGGHLSKKGNAFVSKILIKKIYNERNV
jgi:hypothetical protein